MYRLLFNRLQNDKITKRKKKKMMTDCSHTDTDQGKYLHVGNNQSEHLTLTNQNS